MTQTLFILDSNLKSLLGHYFEYDRSVAEAAVRRGLDCVVLAHRDADLPAGLQIKVRPAYSADIWKTLPGENYHSERNITGVSAAFAAETFAGLDGLDVKSGDIIFLPTITKAQLPGTAAIAHRFAPLGVRVEIMLRYQQAFYDGPMAATAFRQLEKAAARGTVHLCTDSHRLASDLKALTSLPIEVFPIPHTDFLGDDAGPPPETGAPLRMISLGNARGEKGLAEIFDAVALSASESWADRVRFTLQCNDPSDDIVEALANFRVRRDLRVTLVNRVLDTEDYYEVIRQADVVLVPYHRDIYTERTSGVFLEALAAGKVLICTSGTWMSDLLNLHGGGLAIADRSPIALLEAMHTLVNDFPSYQTHAREAAVHWRKVHTPDNLVQHLRGEGDVPATVSLRRAAVIYPWGDVVDGKAGAVLRLRLLVKSLERSYDEVRILYTSGCPGVRSRPSTKTMIEAYCYNSRLNRIFHSGIERLSRLLGGKDGQGFHLWYHLWPLLDPAFHRRCHEIVQWADDIYLEYSYFTPIVQHYCQLLGKSLVVTLYDIVSEQSAGLPFVHRATRYFEFKAIKAAPRVVVVTEKERELCREQGVAAEIIPHPIDLDAHAPLTDEEAAFINESFLGIRLDARICFFVGSSYGPNKEAAAFIRSMARDLHGSAENGDLVFVVAGGCMEPARAGNFIALGMVEDVILSALYKKAAIVLVPLTEGSGSSLKSIEALASGAVMLTTSIGVRGISVSSGTHCVIEDDLRAFPRRIRELLNDPVRMSAMRASAREYGAGLDYRRIFTTYGFPESRSSPDVEPRCADRNDAFLSLLPRARRLNNPEAVRFIYAAAGDPGHPVEVMSHSVPVHGAPQREVRRLTLRRIVRSIALRIPPVGAFYRRTATKIAELTTANGQLKAAYENVSWINAELVKANAELVKTNAELVSANAELAKAHSNQDVLRRSVATILKKISSDAISGDDQRRDILEAVHTQQTISKLGWVIVAERAVAEDSADHLHPRGTQNDNTRHPRFVHACETILGNGLKHMDLGCAGGGLVWDFTRRGHASVGVEGSDFSQLEQRAEWRMIPDRLFTADICYPFRFKDGTGGQVFFDVISAWELFEHIPQDRLPGLLSNISINLRPGGLLAASIATFPDRDEATGVAWHQTVQPRHWWEDLFREARLIPVNDAFEFGDYVRGIGNPRADDWDARRNPEMGFHITLRNGRS